MTIFAFSKDLGRRRTYNQHISPRVCFPYSWTSAEWRGQSVNYFARHFTFMMPPPLFLFLSSSLSLSLSLKATEV